MNIFFKIIFSLFLFFYLYKELHPKIYFIYPSMENRVSIKVTNEDYSTEYLRTSSLEAVYSLPWIWPENSEGIIFMGQNFTEIFLKEDIDFCTLKIFLDEKQNIKKIESTNGFCIKYF